MEPFPGTGCDEKRSMLADCSVTQQTVTELHGKARLRYSRTTFNYSRTPHRHCTRFTYRSPTFTVYFRSYHFEVYFFFCLFSFRSINHANRFSSTFSYHSHYADVSFTFFPSDVWIFSVVLGSLLSAAIDSGKRGKNCFQKKRKNNLCRRKLSRTKNFTTTVPKWRTNAFDDARGWRAGRLCFMWYIAKK